MTPSPDDEPIIIDNRERRRRKQRHHLLLHIQIFLVATMALWILYLLYPVVLPAILGNTRLTFAIEHWPLFIVIPWGGAIALHWLAYLMLLNKRDDQQVSGAFERGLIQPDRRTSRHRLALTDDGEPAADEDDWIAQNEGQRHDR